MIYFDREEILKKASRLYGSGKLQLAYLNGSNTIFPFHISLKKITERMIRQDYTTVRKEAGILERSGLPCKYRTFRFAAIGEQRLPIEVVFDNRIILLEAIGKEEAFENFTQECDFVISKLPRLKTLLIDKPLLLGRHTGMWKQLTAVCMFFLEHPRPGIYLRELAVEGVDTKFIESHKKILDTLLAHLLPNDTYDNSITALSNFGFERKYGLKYPQPLLRFRILDDRSDKG